MKDRDTEKQVPQGEYDRIMRAIKEQTREYPQQALEDIFHI